MIITYQGADYDFDQNGITVDQWRELKRKYKLTPKAFQEGTDEADPDAMTFLFWVMLSQAGQQLTLGDHLKPDVIALNNAFGTAVEAERKASEAEAAAAAAGPDPTKPSASPAPSPSPPAPPAQPTPPGQPREEGAAPTTGS